MDTIADGTLDNCIITAYTLHFAHGSAKSRGEEALGERESLAWQINRRDRVQTLDVCEADPLVGLARVGYQSP